MIKYILLLISIILCSLHCSSYGQSTLGIPGLLSVPTAETLEDGSIAFGVSYTNKKYVNDLNNKFDAAYYFVSVGFLPFLEVSLGITRYMSLPYGQALGDRVPSVRVKLINENETLPSIVIGAHDFMETKDHGTNKLSNALYIVSSKHVKLKSSSYEAGIHLGYGADWIKAFDHHFVGLFGGVSLKYKNLLRGIIEYDTEKVNCGAEITLFNHFKLLGGLMNFNTFSGGICYKTQLF